MVESGADKFSSQVKEEIARVEAMRKSGENFVDANLREIHGEGYSPNSGVVVFEDKK